MKPSNTFAVRNIWVAAALIATGHILDDLDLNQKTGFAEFLFTFDREKDYFDFVDAYWARDVTVDALTFASALRNLKTMISKRRDNGYDEQSERNAEREEGSSYLGSRGMDS